MGIRNIAAVRDALKQHDVDVVGEEVGGSVPRTVKFNIYDGSVVVSAKSGGEKML